MSDPLRPLVQACQRGDEEAFETLYRTFGGGVLNVARRVLRDEDEARDAVQETFLQAFRRFETYRGEGSLKGWLFQIATRVALRLKQRRRPGPSLDEDGAPPAVSPPEHVPDRDFHAAVQREIDRLPEKARLVFLLYTGEQLSHAEIAASLGVTEGTSKSQLNYARGLLRQRLSRWCDDLP